MIWGAIVARSRSAWVGYAAALGAVAMVTLFIGLVLGRAILANASMLYLIAVLATAATSGRGPAVFASVVAFLTFDWFFVTPLHQFTVGDPDEWLSLLLFLMTAIVTGQLAAGQRERAREALGREREAVLLYDVVRLMGDSELDAALEAVADRLRRELHLSELGVDDLRAGRLLVPPPHGWTSTPASERLLSAVAAQVGHAMERDRLRNEATEAEILRRTDQLRAALLSTVSHDLRTPLASIMASAGSLRQPDIDWTSEERLGFAKAIEEEAERLNRIVGNLLDLSRIEAGSLRPEKSWYDLGALVEDVVGRLRTLTARRGHTVHVEVAENLPPLLLDYVEIDEVLYNLVENAAKYAPAGTEIDIAVRREDGSVQVEVADRGPGIPSTALAHLFEPFYRVDGGVSVPKQRPNGLGLGLAVVRGLVEAHGGQVWVQNRAGGGARFVFSLPTSDPPADILAAT